MYHFADRLNGISGSAIRQIFKLLADPDIISFAGGNPSPQSFPSGELAVLASQIISNAPGTVLQYGVTTGMTSLKETVREHLKAIGIHAREDEVIITSGASQGINLTTRAFVNPGDVVLVESPTFLGALQTFYMYQAKVKSVRTDAYGLIPEDLEEKIKQYRPKFLYTIPTFQNPTGRTLALERRQIVLDVCVKYNVLILEDDPYRDLRYSGNPIPPIKSFDASNQVIYLYSFSKIISPGLRVGAAMADNAIIDKFNICKQGEDLHTSNLSQALVDAYCRSGLLKDHIAKTNAMYRQQLQTMLGLLNAEFPEEIRYNTPDGGLFIWVELPEGMNAESLFQKAFAKKVVFVPGEHFYCEQPGKNTLRLNFSMASVQQIEQGMAKLAAAVKEMI
jgi:2-aminoadipate transaminase